MRLQRLLDAVKHHLRRTATFCWTQVVQDPRDPRGCRFGWSELLGALWAGALSGTATLRGVENLTERMGRRISDTTLWRTLVALPVAAFAQLLVEQVRRAWRAKEMQSWLPFSMVAVDGKAIWTGPKAVNPYCQEQSSDTGPSFVMRVLRAVWVSGPCKLTIAQTPIPASQNDMSAFPAFFRQLQRDYGTTELLQVISVDAGFASKANADLIDEAQLGYLIALKSPQQELRAEAERLLALRRKPDAESPWERVKGKRIRRLLFRTTEMAGWNDWTHLREVWRVRQETDQDGQISVEERYFLTNLVPGSTAGDVPLRMVRAHWGIENDSNWTLDMVWGEDDHPWTAAALQVVSLMRLLAYNVVVRLRSRHLRSEENRQRPWENLLQLIEDVLRDGGRSVLLSAPEGQGVAALA